MALITSWNKGAERIFGYTGEEAIGQHITIIVPTRSPGRRSKNIEQLRRGEQVEHFETVRLHKDGTTVNVSVTISPVKDATRRLVGTSTAARDITQQKQAEEAAKEREFSARLLNSRIKNEDASRANYMTEWGNCSLR